MSRQTSISLATLAVVLFTLAPSLSSQGLYIGSDRPTRTDLLASSGQGSVVLTDRKIHAEIVEAGATVQVTERFHNNSKSVLEGTYIFPLPRLAAATGLALFINGKEIQGEVLEAGRARKTYTDIVRRARDPALLEYIDHGLLRASIYPINPGSDVTVELSYLAAVERSGGLYNFGFPLKTSAAGDPRTTITVHISSKLPVRNIYSPTHEIDVIRGSDYAARVGYEGRGATSSNFSLYYTLSENEFGFSLLTHRDQTGENYFMLMISPKLEVEAGKIVARDVVFVIDKSGSMKGEKWQQAKDALKYCIRSLNRDDRFGVLAFSTETQSFATELAPAQDGIKQKACGFLDSLSAAGGTNIHGALLAALSLLAESDRLCTVAFLTDGLPTVGVTDPEQIIREFRSANEQNLRIFNFGVGFDVNTYLLDNLAQSARGATDYIEPGENIEVKVSSYYSKISEPVLSDVTLAFHGVNAYDLYPMRISELFAGSALTVTGKLEKAGRGTVVLNGTAWGRELCFEFSGEFAPDLENRHDFLPRYWAMRKIGYLLNQIRLHGVNDELRDEVIALGRRYGLVTPYTSALVVEEGERLAQAADVPMPQGRNVSGHSGFLVGRGRKATEGQLGRLGGAPPSPGPGGPPPNTLGPRGPATPGSPSAPRGSGSRAHGGEYRGPGDAVPPASGGPGSPAAGPNAGPSSPRASQSGKDKVREAKKLNKLARTGKTGQPSGEQKKGAREEGPEVIQVAGFCLHRLGEVLVDSRFEDEMKAKLIEIKAYGEVYFELLAEHPELKKVFALGEQIIFVLDGKAYEVKPAAEEKKESDEKGTARKPDGKKSD